MYYDEKSSISITYITLTACDTSRDNCEIENHMTKNKQANKWMEKNNNNKYNNNTKLAIKGVYAD